MVHLESPRLNLGCHFDNHFFVFNFTEFNGGKRLTKSIKTPPTHVTQSK